jgi:orotate phosphoribosyltransferase-like protein
MDTRTQDDEISYDDLPIVFQLNVDCDAAAKLHLTEGSKPKHPAKPIVGSKATLYLGGYMVTTDINDQFQMAGQSKKMLAYAADKFECTDNQAIATVNWRAIGRAKKRLKLSPSVRMTKFMYDWLNVGSQKKWVEMASVHAAELKKKTNFIYITAPTRKCKKP